MLLLEPIEEILPFKERMGWNFNWVSSHRNDFNFDYHVSFTEEEMAERRKGPKTGRPLKDILRDLETKG